MKREILKVPKGIRYISEWEEYSLKNFNFPHILNKQITGCGFTEYCLTNDMDIILCSPRRILLENKFDQHQGEVFYFRNESDQILNFDKDLTNTKAEKEAGAEKASRPDEMYNKMYELKREMLQYIDNCRKAKKACKILVTYDSFHLVREFIEGSDYYTPYSFQIVIDEFQSIFIDSRFKSDTEIKFLKDLYGLNRICFVSATPMLDKYLEMLDEFKNLPYFELDWKSDEPLRVVQPNLIVKKCRSLIHEARVVIEGYLNGIYEKVSFSDPLGRIVEIPSKEAVLYFNSVADICDVIKRCGLTPENTNVLCSNTLTNQKKIKKAFKLSCGNTIGGIGTVPKKGEPHKMFTLCTRTVYLGADFYSTNARSFIFSDANVDCLAVDISLDLPQILGRQRLLINPWKNSACLFFKTIRENNKQTRQEFDAVLKEKVNNTEDLIGIFKTQPDDRAKITYVKALKELAETTNYKNNYVSVDFDIESGQLFPVFNNLVLVSEMRAFDIQQVDYKDRFSVLAAVNTISDAIVENNSVSKLLNEFESLHNFQDRMRLICTADLTDTERDVLFCGIPDIYQSYYRVLGPQRCSALGYIKYKLKNEYDRLFNNQKVNISDMIYSHFEVGKKYTLSDIKDYLIGLYESVGYDSTAKATDINEYFNTRPTQILASTENGVKKKVRGFEITSIKNT